MPAYNAELYIARAIESILNQTIKEFELIIIDDSSNDSTYQIAKKYAEIDKRIKLHRNRKNLQIAETLNKGIRLSESKYIARMDADDISHPERLRLQYEYLKKNKEVAVVGANMEIINETGEVVSKREYPTSNEELKEIMFLYSPFAHPVVMMKKKALKEFEGYDVDKVPCEDIDLWFKIGSKYKFGSISRFLLKYTLVPQSNTSSKLKRLELLGFKVKLNAVRKYNHNPSLYDLIYNVGQFVTLWFMPARFRIWLYNYLRSNKYI